MTFATAAAARNTNTVTSLWMPRRGVTEVSDSVESANAQTLSRSLQQRDESCLFEMLITCQSLVNSLVGHANEGEAVGQRPTFILVSPKKIDATLK
jgi:hypothetical protein